VACGAAGGNVDTGVDGDARTPGAYAMDGGEHPAREHPYQGMDGNTRTKWLDKQRGDLVVNFGAPVSVHSYDWATANDAPDRDPVKWSMEGSSDGLRWVPLYSPYARAAFEPTDDRLTYQGPFAVCAGGGAGEPALPRGGPNLVEALVSMPGQFSVLVAAVTAAGLAPTLSGPGPFTVFAPTDTAMAKLGAEAAELLQPENIDKLVEVLEYHVVPRELVAADLGSGMALETVMGAEIELVSVGGQLTLNGVVPAFPPSAPPRPSPFPRPLPPCLARPVRAARAHRRAC
jgi:hypothetical protein